MDQNLPQNQNPPDNFQPVMGGANDTPTASNYPTQPVDPYSEPTVPTSSTKRDDLDLGNKTPDAPTPSIPTAESASNLPSEEGNSSTITGIAPNNSNDKHSVANVKNNSDKKAGVSKMLIYSLILVPLLLVFLAAGGFAAAAYEVLPLPAKYRDMAVSAVNKISFMPKSSRMVLYNMASTKIFDRSYISGSFSSQTDDPTLKELFGSDKMSLTVEGPLIRENGMNNFAFKIAVGELLEVQVHHFDKTLYFNILNAITLDKIMPNLPNTWGSNNPIFNRWVKVDSTEVDNAINQVFGENSESQSALMGDNEKVLDIFRDDVIPFVTSTKEELDGVKVYKLSYYPTDGQVAELITKLSNVSYSASSADGQEVNPAMQNTSPVIMKNVKIDLWVEMSTYKIRKYSSTSTFSSSMSPANYTNVLGTATPALAQTREQLIQAQGQSMNDINLVYEVRIDPLDDSVSVIVPKETVTFEEYYTSVINHVTNLMAPPPVILEDENGIDEGSFGFEQASIRHALPDTAMSTEDLNLLGIQ